MHVRARACACAIECVYTCVRVRACMCVCACVRLCACVRVRAPLSRRRYAQHPQDGAATLQRSALRTAAAEGLCVLTNRTLHALPPQVRPSVRPPVRKYSRSVGVVLASFSCKTARNASRRGCFVKYARSSAHVALCRCLEQS